MKSILMAVMVLLSASAIAQTKTETFKVYGNCGMCKKRIEKAVKVDGVDKAEWNVQSKMMTVSYDASKISNESIQQKIAAVGYDTEKATADDKIYEKLPGCCQYNRKNSGKKDDHSGHQH